MANFMQEIFPNTFREWVFKNYDKDQLRDIAEYGAENGFSGMIHYHETTTLYNRYEKELWESMKKQAGNKGYKSVIGFLAAIDDGINEPHAFKNLVVWRVSEETARELLDTWEDEEEDNLEKSGV